MSDHNESDCPHLHPEIDYHVRAYKLTAGAIAFETWFNTVFKAQTGAHEDFEFERKEFQGDNYLEVMQNNPMFSIDALEVLFEASRAPAKTSATVIDFKKSMN